MLVKVHHLETIERVRDVLDLLLLAFWNLFDTWSVPVDIISLGSYSLEGRQKEHSTHHLM